LSWKKHVTIFLSLLDIVLLNAEVSVSNSAHGQFEFYLEEMPLPEWGVRIPCLTDALNSSAIFPF
jgi:hypothetical protein